jgi:hypothetical protein
MLLAIKFPLTLTLSPEERELPSAVSRYSSNGDPFPAPPMVSLSRGVRAGVREETGELPFAHKDRQC